MSSNNNINSSTNNTNQSNLPIAINAMNNFFELDIFIYFLKEITSYAKNNFTNFCTILASSITVILVLIMTFAYSYQSGMFFIYHILHKTPNKEGTNYFVIN